MWSFGELAPGDADDAVAGGLDLVAADRLVDQRSGQVVLRDQGEEAVLEAPRCG